MKKGLLSLGTIGSTTLLFIIIALFFGLIIVKEVPLFWGYDESAHFGRAYQISEGQFLPQRLPNGNYGGYVPRGVVSLDLAARSDLSNPGLTAVIGRHDDKHSSLQKKIASQTIDQRSKKSFVFPGSASYSPFAYIAPATGILVCRIADCSLGQTIMMARGFSLALYICLVAFSLWLLRDRKLRWLVFSVALLPMAVFQAAAVSADGPVIALSLLLFSLVIKALVDKKLATPLLILLGFTALLLPLVKSIYGLLDLCLLPVAAALYKDRGKALRYASVTIAAIALVTLGWLHAAHGATKAISLLQAPSPGSNNVVSVRKQTRLILHQPQVLGQALVNTAVLDEPYWVNSTVGEFALNTVQLPLGAVVLADIMIVASVFYASNELVRYRNYAAALGFISILAALGILITLYLTFTYVGKTYIDGVQGRYFIPLIPFFFVAVAVVIPAKVLMSPKTAAILFSASSCALLLSGVVYYGLATY
jgi:uncharacterized membrane protein